MKRSYTVGRIVAGIVVCMIVLGLSTSTGRDRNGYEVEAHVYGVAPAQSDAARAINANERLMERYMDMTERHLIDLAADLKVLTVKIDSVDARLTQLDQRLERIEKHLGIAPAPARPDPNAPPASKTPAADPLAAQPQPR
ncbi:MAG: hypothetical protein ABFE13_20590 [Phycisphaerales bacterium]